MALSGFFAHSVTTQGITVRVAPRFLADQSDPSRSHYVWSYHVRVENHGDTAVQLLRRHWIITDGEGQVSEIEGEGVVGEQPHIAPGGSFDYISGCPLPTPNGAMKGSYTVESETGCFEVAIPSFALASHPSSPSPSAA
jgi:ApaG protein